MGVAHARPDLMRLVAEAITIWPFIEHQMAMILGLLLGSNTEASLAVFSTLRTGRNQRDAITAAAEAILNERDQELMAAALSVFRTAEKARSDLAHAHWGVIEEDKDVLVWTETKHHAPWNTAVLASEQRGQPRPSHDDLARHFFVYTKVDLEEAIDLLKRVWRISFDLVRYVRLGDPAREQAYGPLSAEPLLRSALDHLQKGKNNQ